MPSEPTGEAKKKEERKAENNEDALICQEYCPNREKIQALQEKDLSKEDLRKLAATFKILGDPTRLKIINVLARDELCVCDISELLEMSQSAISHQLKKLRDLDLVKYRKEGRKIYYSLSDRHIMQLFCQGLQHVKE